MQTLLQNDEFAGIRARITSRGVYMTFIYLTDVKFFLNLEMHSSRSTKPTGSFIRKAGIEEYVENLLKFAKHQETNYNRRKSSTPFTFTVYKTGCKSV